MKAKQENWRVKDLHTWTQLRFIASKLQHGYELTPQEGVMAGNLLQMVTDYKDVRLLLSEKVKAAPRNANHFSIAMHYHLLKPEGADAAALAVANAWGYKGKEPGKSIKRVARLRRTDCEQALNGANDKTLAWHLQQARDEAPLNEDGSKKEIRSKK